MTDNDPTLGEVVRRLEDVTRQLGVLITQFTELPERLDSTYVRKETYTVQQRADAQIAKDLRTDLDAIVEQGRTTRRLLWSTAAAPLLVAVLTALLIARLYR